MGLTYSQFVGESSNQPCVVENDIDLDKIFLPLGGILSTLSYFYLFYLYFWRKLPTLMRHPSTLAVYKCIFELMFVQQYIWVPFLPNNALYISASDDGNCISTPVTGFLSFWSQFFLLGGELWFLVISMDLQMSYSNPFSSFKMYQGYYYALIYGVSLLYSILLVSLGSVAYGLSSIGAVWIQDRKGQDNYIKIVCFYSVMAFIYAYCLFIVLSLSIKMRKGFAETLGVRLSIMTRSRAYIIGYSIFWAVVFSFEFVSFLMYTKDNSLAMSNNFSSGSAYCFAFRGVWALVMIIGPNWVDLTWNDLLFGHNPLSYHKDIDTTVHEKLLMKPHLNSALRAEILYFTTQGIMFAAKQAQLAQHQAEISRLSVDAERHTDMNDDDIRGSSFSFKDIMERLSVQTDQSARQSFVFGGAPATSRLVPTASKRLTPHAEELRIGVSSDSVAQTPIVAIHQRMLQQNNLIHQSVLLEVEQNLRSLGEAGIDISNGETEETGAHNGTSRELSVANSVDSDHGPKSIEMMESTVPRSSDQFLEMLNGNHYDDFDGGMDLDSVINSPFHDQANENRDRVFSDTSAHSNDSAATIKWAEATDLHFKLASNSLNGGALGSADAGVWKTVGGQASDRGHRKKVGSSQIERLAKSFADAFSVATAAATSAVYGTYDEFCLTDFSSKQFATLRKMSGIDTERYIESFKSTVNENFSEGRSGAFMFNSADCRYFVKTTTASEVQTLLRILPGYIAHLRNNPNTLLTRFLGAHCITMYSTKLYFLVMANVFPRERLSEKFDLKGSWVNRFGNTGGRQTRRERMKAIENVKSVPLYQDNDLQQKIALKGDIPLRLMKQISADTKFLAAENIMDYSLIIGIVRRNFEVANAENVLGQVEYIDDVEQQPAQSIASDGRVPTSVTFSHDFAGGPSSDYGIRLDDLLREGIHADVVEAPGTYYLGVIDALQEWNWRKKLERLYKVRILGKEAAGISAIDPISYQVRFMQRAVIDVFDGLENYSRESVPIAHAVRGSGTRVVSERISGNVVVTGEQYLTLADKRGMDL